MIERKSFFLLLVMVLALSGLASCNRPELTGMDFDVIDTTKDPMQIPPSSKEPIIIETKDYQFKLNPEAEYQVSGVVVSKETYSFGWEAKISPVDLAIAWGKLAEPEYGRYVTYSQSNRWYFYKVKPGSPFDLSYVISHSSNHHIIPAGLNVERALRILQEKEKIILRGYLVNIEGTVEGNRVSWNTSLSRTDTGNGSCELFYVTKVRIDNHVYE